MGASLGASLQTEWCESGMFIVVTGEIPAAALLLKVTIVGSSSGSIDLAQELSHWAKAIYVPYV